MNFCDKVQHKVNYAMLDTPPIQQLLPVHLSRLSLPW